MPVTVYPQPSRVGTTSWKTFTTARDILRAVGSHSDNRRPILRSSYPTDATLPPSQSPTVVTISSTTTAIPSTPTAGENIIPCSNGLVHTILHAWERDLHLTLRPDDVWLGVLTQLSFFVNGRAEALRAFFVSHAGKKLVKLDMRPHNLDTVPLDQVAHGLVGLVREHMTDKEMVEWLIPRFSTTREHDRAVAAMVFLGTMQQYFNYMVLVSCGFPSVTLEGERADWEDLAARVARLAQFGDEAEEWARYLGKAVEGMVASFDKPEDESVKDFWMKACPALGSRGSGQPYILSGWLTAFCWWTAEGARHEVSEYNRRGREQLDLDGVVFPVMDRDRIPAGTTRAPISWRNTEAGEDLKTVLVAGSTGMKLTDDTRSSVRPVSGWWILEGED